VSLLVWVAGVLGTHLLNKLVRRVHPKVKMESTTLQHLQQALIEHLKSIKMLFSFIFDSLDEFFGFFCVIGGFVAFLFINGSIVGKF